MVAVTWIAAKGVDPVDHSKDQTGEGSRRVGRMWRNIQIKIQGLLKKTSGNRTIKMQRDGKVQEVYLICTFTDLPA